MRAARALLVALCLLAAPGGAGAMSRTILLHPAEAFQGSVIKITVLGSEFEAVSGQFEQRSVPFFPDEGSYTSLFGIDLEHKPGPVEMIIRGRRAEAGQWEEKLLLRIKKKMFLREELTVPPAFDRIDEASRKRIDREQAALARLWALTTSKRLWEGSFLRPVVGGVTAPFGLRRVINGLPRSPHGGVDFKASLGTEIRAANHGRVVLRDEFYFSGKSIVLDHGAGLYTMYFHLSEYAVEREAPVHKGEVIGRAGMSGRVTGPHLHWAVRLNGARVDPLELLETKP